MNSAPVYICGAGIISPLGAGLAETETKLRENHSAISPLKLFPLLQGNPLPTGESPCSTVTSSIPRTHFLARLAADEAMAGQEQPPDAIILGSTTGGILTTEELLYREEKRKEQFKHHGLHTIATDLAQHLQCCGPVIVVSTACSSGAVAISLAQKMLRRGEAKTILAGGVDSLSRLTYFGFNSLQLVDRNGCKPLDSNRLGMAVSEGAGMLLLSSEQQDSHLAILGTGLSCDAYHGAAPHPEGVGAQAAMEQALADADCSPECIDYINLHGTGTPDNDLAESKAIRNTFATLPPLSSVKGATGHTLAAAGAVEAVIATLAISKNLLPANTNLQQIDPALELSPVLEPREESITTVLSNSFGFGGNNGSLIIGKAPQGTKQLPSKPDKLAIHGFSCLTGAGDLQESLLKLEAGQPINGMSGNDQISKNLPPRLVRRLKRLPRMALALTMDAMASAGETDVKPHSIFMGTGWGALSETHDFLERLMETEEQFSSPIDFVGSVHNAPASQVAIMLGSKGANITSSGGNYSFEQALLTAELHLEDTEPALLLGADEGHAIFSPLFDPSISPDSRLSDGGGAFYISRQQRGAKCFLTLPYFRSSSDKATITRLLENLENTLDNECALILAGIPKAMEKEGESQLAGFLKASEIEVPVIPYRKFTGEFASASAIATAMAASFLESNRVPAHIMSGKDLILTEKKRKILILGLGEYISVMEISRP